MLIQHTMSCDSFDLKSNANKILLNWTLHEQRRQVEDADQIHNCLDKHSFVIVLTSAEFHDLIECNSKSMQTW